MGGEPRHKASFCDLENAWLSIEPMEFHSGGSVGAHVRPRVLHKCCVRIFETVQVTSPLESKPEEGNTSVLGNFLTLV